MSHQLASYLLELTFLGHLHRITNFLCPKMVDPEQDALHILTFRLFKLHVHSTLVAAIQQ